MSFLCSCAGRRRKRDESDDRQEYYRRRSRSASRTPPLAPTAATPKVKRKFPTGIAPTPSVPSDLEENSAAAVAAAKTSKKLAKPNASVKQVPDKANEQTPKVKISVPGAKLVDPQSDKRLPLPATAPVSKCTIGTMTAPGSGEVTGYEQTILPRVRKKSPPVLSARMEVKLKSTKRPEPFSTSTPIEDACGSSGSDTPGGYEASISSSDAGSPRDAQTQCTFSDFSDDESSLLSLGREEGDYESTVSELRDPSADPGVTGQEVWDPGFLQHDRIWMDIKSTLMDLISDKQSPAFHELAESMRPPDLTYCTVFRKMDGTVTHKAREEKKKARHSFGGVPADKVPGSRGKLNLIALRDQSDQPSKYQDDSRRQSRGSGDYEDWNPGSGYGEKLFTPDDEVSEFYFGKRSSSESDVPSGQRPKARLAPDEEITDFYFGRGASSEMDLSQRKTESQITLRSFPGGTSEALRSSLSAIWANSSTKEDKMGGSAAELTVPRTETDLPDKVVTEALLDFERKVVSMESENEAPQESKPEERSAEFEVDTKGTNDPVTNHENKKEDLGNVTYPAVKLREKSVIKPFDRSVSETSSRRAREGTPITHDLKAQKDLWRQGVAFEGREFDVKDVDLETMEVEPVSPEMHEKNRQHPKRVTRRKETTQIRTVSLDYENRSPKVARKRPSRPVIIQPYTPPRSSQPSSKDHSKHKLKLKREDRIDMSFDDSPDNIPVDSSIAQVSCPTSGENSSHQNNDRVTDISSKDVKPEITDIVEATTGLKSPGVVRSVIAGRFHVDTRSLSTETSSESEPNDPRYRDVTGSRPIEDNVSKVRSEVRLPSKQDRQSPPVPEIDTVSRFVSKPSEVKKLGRIELISSVEEDEQVDSQKRRAKKSRNVNRFLPPGGLKNLTKEDDSQETRDSNTEEQLRRQPSEGSTNEPDLVLGHGSPHSSVDVPLSVFRTSLEESKGSPDVIVQCLGDVSSFGYESPETSKSVDFDAVKRGSETLEKSQTMFSAASTSVETVISAGRTGSESLDNELFDIRSTNLQQKMQTMRNISADTDVQADCKSNLFSSFERDTSVAEPSDEIQYGDSSSFVEEDSKLTENKNIGRSKFLDSLLSSNGDDVMNFDDQFTPRKLLESSLSETIEQVPQINASSVDDTITPIDVEKMTAGTVNIKMSPPTNESCVREQNVASSFINPPSVETCIPEVEFPSPLMSPFADPQSSSFENIAVPKASPRNLLNTFEDISVPDVSPRNTTAAFEDIFLNDVSTKHVSAAFDDICVPELTSHSSQHVSLPYVPPRNPSSFSEDLPLPDIPPADKPYLDDAASVQNDFYKDASAASVGPTLPVVPPRSKPPKFGATYLPEIPPRPTSIDLSLPDISPSSTRSLSTSSSTPIVPPRCTSAFGGGSTPEVPPRPKSSNFENSCKPEIPPRITSQIAKTTATQVVSPNTIVSAFEDIPVPEDTGDIPSPGNVSKPSTTFEDTFAEVLSEIVSERDKDVALPEIPPRTSAVTSEGTSLVESRDGSVNIEDIPLPDVPPRNIALVRERTSSPDSICASPKRSSSGSDSVHPLPKIETTVDETPLGSRVQSPNSVRDDCSLNSRTPRLRLSDIVITGSGEEKLLALSSKVDDILEEPRSENVDELSTVRDILQDSNGPKCSNIIYEDTSDIHKPNTSDMSAVALSSKLVAASDTKSSIVEQEKTNGAEKECKEAISEKVGEEEIVTENSNVKGKKSDKKKSDKKGEKAVKAVKTGKSKKANAKQDLQFPPPDRPFRVAVRPSEKLRNLSKSSESSSPRSSDSVITESSTDILDSIEFPGISSLESSPKTIEESVKTPTGLPEDRIDMHPSETQSIVEEEEKPLQAGNEHPNENHSTESRSLRNSAMEFVHNVVDSVMAKGTEITGYFQHVVSTDTKTDLPKPSSKLSPDRDSLEDVPLHKEASSLDRTAHCSPRDSLDREITLGMSKIDLNSPRDSLDGGKARSDSNLTVDSLGESNIRDAQKTQSQSPSDSLNGNQFNASSELFSQRVDVDRGSETISFLPSPRDSLDRSPPRNEPTLNEQFGKSMSDDQILDFDSIWSPQISSRESASSFDTSVSKSSVSVTAPGVIARPHLVPLPSRKEAASQVNDKTSSTRNFSSQNEPQLRNEAFKIAAPSFQTPLENDKDSFDGLPKKFPKGDFKLLDRTPSEDVALKDDASSISSRESPRDSVSSKRESSTTLSDSRLSTTDTSVIDEILGVTANPIVKEWSEISSARTSDSPIPGSPHIPLFRASLAKEESLSSSPVASPRDSIEESQTKGSQSDSPQHQPKVGATLNSSGSFSPQFTPKNSLDVDISLEVSENLPDSHRYSLLDAVKPTSQSDSTNENSDASKPPLTRMSEKELTESFQKFFSHLDPKLTALRDSTMSSVSGDSRKSATSDSDFDLVDFTEPDLLVLSDLPEEPTHTDAGDQNIPVESPKEATRTRSMLSGEFDIKYIDTSSFDSDRTPRPESGAESSPTREVANVMEELVNVLEGVEKGFDTDASSTSKLSTLTERSDEESLKDRESCAESRSVDTEVPLEAKSEEGRVVSKTTSGNSLPTEEVDSILEEMVNSLLSPETQDGVDLRKDAKETENKSSANKEEKSVELKPSNEAGSALSISLTEAYQTGQRESIGKEDGNEQKIPIVSTDDEKSAVSIDDNVDNSESIVRHARESKTLIDNVKGETGIRESSFDLSKKVKDIILSTPNIESQTNDPSLSATKNELEKSKQEHYPGIEREAPIRDNIKFDDISVSPRHDATVESLLGDDIMKFRKDNETRSSSESRTISQETEQSFDSSSMISEKNVLLSSELVSQTKEESSSTSKKKKSKFHSKDAAKSSSLDETSFTGISDHEELPPVEKGEDEIKKQAGNWSQSFSVDTQNILGKEDSNFLIKLTNLEMPSLSSQTSINDVNDNSILPGTKMNNVDVTSTTPVGIEDTVIISDARKLPVERETSNIETNAKTGSEYHEKVSQEKCIILKLEDKISPEKTTHVAAAVQQGTQDSKDTFSIDSAKPEEKANDSGVEEEEPCILRDKKEANKSTEKSKSRGRQDINSDELADMIQKQLTSVSHGEIDESAFEWGGAIRRDKKSRKSVKGSSSRSVSIEENNLSLEQSNKDSNQVEGDTPLRTLECVEENKSEINDEIAQSREGEEMRRVIGSSDIILESIPPTWTGSESGKYSQVEDKPYLILESKSSDDEIVALDYSQLPEQFERKLSLEESTKESPKGGRKSKSILKSSGSKSSSSDEGSAVLSEIDVQSPVASQIRGKASFYSKDDVIQENKEKKSMRKLKSRSSSREEEYPLPDTSFIDEKFVTSFTESKTREGISDISEFSFCEPRSPRSLRRRSSSKSVSFEDEIIFESLDEIVESLPELESENSEVFEPPIEKPRKSTVDPRKSPKEKRRTMEKLNEDRNEGTLPVFGSFEVIPEDVVSERENQVIEKINSREIPAEMVVELAKESPVDDNANPNFELAGPSEVISIQDVTKSKMERRKSPKKKSKSSKGNECGKEIQESRETSITCVKPCELDVLEDISGESLIPTKHEKSQEQKSNILDEAGTSGEVPLIEEKPKEKIERKKSPKKKHKPKASPEEGSFPVSESPCPLSEEPLISMIVTQDCMSQEVVEHPEKPFTKVERRKSPRKKKKNFENTGFVESSGAFDAPAVIENISEVPVREQIDTWSLGTEHAAISDSVKEEDTQNASKLERRKSPKKKLKSKGMKQEDDAFEHSRTSTDSYLPTVAAFQIDKDEDTFLDVTSWDTKMPSTSETEEKKLQLQNKSKTSKESVDSTTTSIQESNIDTNVAIREGSDSAENAEPADSGHCDINQIVITADTPENRLSTGSFVYPKSVDFFTTITSSRPESMESQFSKSLPSSRSSLELVGQKSTESVASNLSWHLPPKVDVRTMFVGNVMSSSKPNSETLEIPSDARPWESVANSTTNLTDAADSSPNLQQTFGDTPPFQSLSFEEALKAYREQNKKTKDKPADIQKKPESVNEQSADFDGSFEIERSHSHDEPKRVSVSSPILKDQADSIFKKPMSPVSRTSSSSFDKIPSMKSSEKSFDLQIQDLEKERALSVGSVSKSGSVSSVQSLRGILKKSRSSENSTTDTGMSEFSVGHGSVLDSKGVSRSNSNTSENVTETNSCLDVGNIGTVDISTEVQPTQFSKSSSYLEISSPTTGTIEQEGSSESDSSRVYAKPSTASPKPRSAVQSFEEFVKGAVTTEEDDAGSDDRLLDSPADIMSENIDVVPANQSVVPISVSAPLRWSTVLPENIDFLLDKPLPEDQNLVPQKETIPTEKDLPRSRKSDVDKDSVNVLEPYGKKTSKGKVLDTSEVKLGTPQNNLVQSDVQGKSKSVNKMDTFNVERPGSETKTSDAPSTSSEIKRNKKTGFPNATFEASVTNTTSNLKSKSQDSEISKRDNQNVKRGVLDTQTSTSNIPTNAPHVKSATKPTNATLDTQTKSKSKITATKPESKPDQNQKSIAKSPETKPNLKQSAKEGKAPSKNAGDIVKSAVRSALDVAMGFLQVDTNRDRRERSKTPQREVEPVALTAPSIAPAPSPSARRRARAKARRRAATGALSSVPLCAIEPFDWAAEVEAELPLEEGAVPGEEILAAGAATPGAKRRRKRHRRKRRVDAAPDPDPAAPPPTAAVAAAPTAAAAAAAAAAVADTSATIAPPGTIKRLKSCEEDSDGAALDLAQNSNVQDAFVIAVEQQARERLERLTALKKIKPVDMSKLSQQLNQQLPASEQQQQELNGFIESAPIYVTSIPTAATASAPAAARPQQPLPPGSRPPPAQAQARQPAPLHKLPAAAVAPSNGHASSVEEPDSAELELKQELPPDHLLRQQQQQPQPAAALPQPQPPQSPFGNGRTEVLIGGGAADDEEPGATAPAAAYAAARVRTTAIVESGQPGARLLPGEDPALRPRRRSGGGIVVVDAEPVKAPLGGPDLGLALSPQEAQAHAMMLAALHEPHREMAVDVPESFVARSKTPPRYPPPRPVGSAAPAAALSPAPAPALPQPSARLAPQQQVPPTYANMSTSLGNGSAAGAGVTNSTPVTVGTTGIASTTSSTKPVPPPRDHLRIERDGRLVNRAPPPQLPARAAPVTPITTPATTTTITTTTTTPAPAVAAVQNHDPTKEQLDSIRKFQEALRRRREEEERLAAEAEFLNRSLRGSRKLQALEAHPLPAPPTGVVNDAYASSAGDDDDDDDEGEDGGGGGDDGDERLPQPQPPPPLGDDELRAYEHLRRVVGYGELVASLQRLQLQLKRSAAAGGAGAAALLSPLEAQLAAVHALLLSPHFGRALAVHNVLQQARRRGLARRPSPPPAPAAAPVPAPIAPAAAPTTLLQPACANAQALVRDCLDTLQPCSLAAAAELADLLTRYELEGLLLAHDAIAGAVGAAGVAPAPASTPAAPPPPHPDDNIRIIKIEKTNEPLGATVRNEGEAVVIGRVVRGGAADKSGLLREGDEVLEVNGVEMRGKSVNEVCDLLASMTGTLTFLVVPGNGGPAVPRPPGHRDTLLHMKAHFDYDPEEDLYIPCRELGISFQKGDVLHIISQDDPNWWQAYREGEEDQTLAGLVPSRSFQHQRESMKQTIAGDRVTKEKSKKAGTLLCAKKNPKKKKKKMPYTDGGYPFYATSTIDDYDADEILTYEEVALYYPRANQKRPIVLIGPPNIGRHELRQRLMEDADRFAAAIPHTSRIRKEGEVDGQDYHFISRAQFEADILARRFVEHGEYEKAYYGTSLDAIRSVVQAGKICVLNLHPQSLKILRSSDLKPYVVFVAPPSLEKLRQKKIINGEAFKEDELKDIIEKAREMEDKYGHFFDMIIINNDTDRAYRQLLDEINSLEREPQWVPAAWVKTT